MNRSCIRPWLVGGLLWVAALDLRGASLPFTVSTEDGLWKSSVVQQPVAPDIYFELVVSHVGAADRLIVLSSPITGDPAESLGDFGRRLIASFTTSRNTDITEKAATEIGYNGRELQFDRTAEKEVFACTLFVFVAGPTRWGVVYARPKEMPEPAVPAFSLLHQAVALPTGVTAMAPLRVKDAPLSAFPLSFRITRSSNTDHVQHIEVTEVPEGSETDRAGVRVGDAIVAIDGRAVGDFAVGVGKESELGRIFLNRSLGEQVKLELTHPDSDKKFSVTLGVSSPRDHSWR